MYVYAQTNMTMRRLLASSSEVGPEPREQAGACRADPEQRLWVRKNTDGSSKREVRRSKTGGKA